MIDSGLMAVSIMPAVAGEAARQEADFPFMDNGQGAVLDKSLFIENPLCCSHCVCWDLCVQGGDFLETRLVPDRGMLSKPSARWGRFV